MIKWCKKCVLPNTRPNLKFDENGICSACTNFVKKESINWKKRENIFKKIIKEAKTKSKGYDCLIPVSGGKDSTWQVVTALKYGLKTLAVSWKTPFRTKLGQKNLDNLISLGVDHIDWTVNPKIEKKIVTETFKSKGSSAISMHSAIFNLPSQIALRFKIPLIIWGENSSYEYGNDNNSDSNYKLNKKWIKKYGANNNVNVQTLVKKYFKNKYTASYQNEYLEKKVKYQSVFLGHFFSWDPKKIFKEASKHGFTNALKAEVGYYDFADVDDDCIMPIHHWLKWYKFGFTREYDNLSIEIRNQRISRKKAIRLLQKKNYVIPTKAINKFCNYYNIDKKKFYSDCEKFRNKKIWKKKNNKIVLINNINEN